MKSMSDSCGLLLIPAPCSFEAGSAACPRWGEGLYMRRKPEWKAPSCRPGGGASVRCAELAHEAAHLVERQVAAHHLVVEDEGGRARDRKLLGEFARGRE